MAHDFIPFSRPCLGNEEIAEVLDTLKSDWITSGPKVKQFEKDFAEFVGAPAALAVSSCTAALEIALATVGVGPGDVVITSPLTFCATVNVIEHLGARPLLVDVEPDTLNIDPAGIAAALNGPNGSKVKAIVPVHLYGHACEMDRIFELARVRNIPVIEDAAHALPSRYRGRMVGQLGEVAGIPLLTCYSFYPTKNMTTAEGGMIAGSAELVDEARIWGLHGMSTDAWKRYGKGGRWKYSVTRPGFKANMTDIQAALGLHQLRKLDGFWKRRREIVAAYNHAFEGVAEIQRPTERPEVQHAWHVYCIRLGLDRLAIDRDEFISILQGAGIGTSVHFIPIHLHDFYRDKYGYKPEDFPIAFDAFQQMLSLPLHPRLTEEEANRVITNVLNLVRTHNKTAAIGQASR